MCIRDSYDLRKEFPALTLRKTALKSCMDEILWIWQKKSNNIHDLHSHIWDSWADENGSIGKAYGYQMSVKHSYKEGMMDQVDRVLYDLKKDVYKRQSFHRADYGETWKAEGACEGISWRFTYKRKRIQLEKNYDHLCFLQSRCV